MKLIRRILTGTEFWDSVNKKTVFVPKGKKLNIDGKLEKRLTKLGVSAVEAVDNLRTAEESLNKMNIKQLKAFAKEKGIDIPGIMKKEETIRKYIEEQLTAIADDE